MQAAIEHIDPARHADELRDMWQGRVLALAQGRMMLAVTSMLSHAYEEALPVLLRVVRPKCWDDGRLSLKAPFLVSIAKVNKRGQVVADAMMFDGALPARDAVMFSSTRDFEYELRKLADAAKLSDADRRQFFIVARKWVASDQRLDPTMDPNDPDAKRLTLN